ncbi:MAG: alpha/beta fold hydrolase [Pseudomonadota bacterium]
MKISAFTARRPIDQSMSTKFADRFPSRRSQLLVIAVFVVSFAAGCGSKPARLPLIDPANFAGTAHDVIVATNRRATDDPLLPFGDERSDSLSLNEVSVWVPADRKQGAIEYPSSAPDPETEFALTRFSPLNDSQLTEELNERLAALVGEKQIFLFVHGYNVPYSNGVYRIGQMIEDFETNAVPVHFSWPSSGRTLGYLYDRDSVQFARDGLVEFLKLISKSDASSIFVMGHSMGTLLVMESLRQLSLSGESDVLALISPLVLASPDIDVDVFRSQLNSLSERPDPIVVFVANDDGALKLSQTLRGGHPRVGEGKDIEVLQEQGIAVIDLSEVDLGDGTQHSAFASSPTLIDIINQASAARQTLVDADTREERSPLEDLSEFTKGLLYLPKKVLAPED